MTPLKDSRYTALIVGAKALSKVEMISLININNTSYAEFFHNTQDRLEKYNPKIYMKETNSLGPQWIRQIQYSTYSHWPKRKCWDIPTFYICLISSSTV